MTYISQDKRSLLNEYIDSLHHTLVGLEADDENNNMESNLDYIIIRLLFMVYGTLDTTNDKQINDAVGLLERAKLEFARKVAFPYENQKEFENGQVEANITPIYTKEVLVKKKEE
jgi:hypothetical protein